MTNAAAAVAEGALKAESAMSFDTVDETLHKVARAAEDGAELAEVLGAELVDDAGEVDLYRDALGSAYEAMVADWVPWPALKVAAVTAWLDAAVSREAAKAYWNAAGDPERLAGNRASRRAARSTRRPGSESGTTRTQRRRRRWVLVVGSLRALVARKG